MRKDFISVVIPAYNEEERIMPTVRRILEYLKDNFAEFEIIVVDDGSSDGTSGLVRGSGLEGVRLIQNPENMGKGAAIRNGILSSKGSLVLISDADMSTPIEEAGRLMAALDEGWDIAIGSRALRESDIAIRQPWYRQGMGKVFNLFVRLLLFGGFKDTQCGFKLFKGEGARAVFSKCRINGFGFDPEALFIAMKSGMRIKEVPIRWLNSPKSKVGLFSDPPKMVLDLLRIRANRLRGLYR